MLNQAYHAVFACCICSSFLFYGGNTCLALLTCVLCHLSMPQLRSGPEDCYICHMAAILTLVAPVAAGAARQVYLHREGRHVQLWCGPMGDLCRRSPQWQAAQTPQVCTPATEGLNASMKFSLMLLKLCPLSVQLPAVFMVMCICALCFCKFSQGCHGSVWHSCFLARHVQVPSMTLHDPALPFSYLKFQQCWHLDFV